MRYNDDVDPPNWRSFSGLDLFSSHTRHAKCQKVWLENLEISPSCPTADNVILCTDCCKLYLFVYIITQACPLLEKLHTTTYKVPW